MPWIWEQARRRLSPRASWCVDVYHVSEKLHACGRSMWGEGEAARSWAGGELWELIRAGGPGYIRRLDERSAATTGEADLGALAALRVYLVGNADRMGYAQRLGQGKPIGSGSIEEACKRIGTRMKLNNTRWRPRRAERFAALRCLDDADQNRSHWFSRAA